MRVLVRLPVPVFGLLLGREWFVEAATAPVRKPATAIFPPDREDHDLGGSGTGAVP
jgi:hypothetical protein